MQRDIVRLSEISFSDDGDYDLMGYMAMKNDDPPAARAAWEEFYCRHSRYIFGALEKAHGEHLDADSLLDLAAETLIRVYEKADKFKGNPEVKELEIQRHHVRGWMAKIAENIYIDQFREQKGFQIILPEDETEWEQISFEVFIGEQARNGDGLNELRKLKLQWMDEAFQNLNENEQYVIRATAAYERPDRTHQRLPNKVSKELARALNTTSDNVRQIRKRAKDAIEKYVKQKEAERSMYERNR